jgi:threonine-phosphate decarboxylase
MTAHGGDVWDLAEDVLDFSANVNPRGLPVAALEFLSRPPALRRYPDREARTLRQALSKQLDVPVEAIVVGPGAEALLAPGLRAMHATRALVPVPAFSEYRRVCTQQRVEFLPFALERVDRLPATVGSGDAIILNNPHNPTGRLFDRLETDAPVLLDEAFIDYVPGASLVCEGAARKGLIVVRSLTKFYGCPALRVGYAVAHPDTAREIAAFLPTWPVMQMAMDALAIAIEDREYAETTLRENAVHRGSLLAGLEALGLTVFPSAANYLFAELPTGAPASAELRQRLIDRHRILIRNCDSYETLEPGKYVRFAVLSAGDNDRLVAALATELNL